jgi:hypothetical protein
MLSLFVGSVGESRSQALGAVAVKATKMMAWDQLTLYFGEEMLLRRTAELLAAVTRDGLELSDEEHDALELAADYATGNRPETSFDRIMRIQEGGKPIEITPEDGASIEIGSVIEPSGDSD